MDKRKIDILKAIDKAKNNNYSEDYSSLNKKSFDNGMLRSMCDKDLIKYSGSDFYLTDKGEMVLRESLMIEALYKKNKSKIKIIFDSNIFDDIASGNLGINSLNKEKYDFFITHIQLDEINNCSDKEKRLQLLLFLTKIAPIVMATESLVLGTSRLGEAKFSDGKLFEKLRNGNHKHTNDALIGETAIKNDILLVTNDNKLRKRVHSNGGRAVNLDEFKGMLNND